MIQVYMRKQLMKLYMTSHWWKSTWTTTKTIDVVEHDQQLMKFYMTNKLRKSTRPTATEKKSTLTTSDEMITQQVIKSLRDQELTKFCMTNNSWWNSAWPTRIDESLHDQQQLMTVYMTSINWWQSTWPASTEDQQQFMKFCMTNSS